MLVWTPAQSFQSLNFEQWNIIFQQFLSVQLPFINSQRRRRKSWMRRRSMTWTRKTMPGWIWSMISGEARGSVRSLTTSSSSWSTALRKSCTWRVWTSAVKSMPPSTRMPSAASAWTESVTTATPSCFATCATWPCTRNVTVCPTFLRASGSADTASRRPPSPQTAYSVLTRAERWKGPMTTAGATSFAPSGSPRWASPTPPLSSPSTGSATFLQPAGSSPATSAKRKVSARASSATKPTVIRPSMWAVPKRLASSWRWSQSRRWQKRGSPRSLWKRRPTVELTRLTGA